MVYEILTKLKTSTYIRNRNFGKGHVTAATKNPKTKLRNTKLEKEILGLQSHSAYSILSSFEQIQIV